ncbi:MAG: Ig-like domain repeat protein, partial [Acidobacteriota bacterium]
MNIAERNSFARRVAALGLLAASVTMLGLGVSAAHEPSPSAPIAPAPHAAQSVRPHSSLAPSGAALQFAPAMLTPLAGGAATYNEGGVGSAVNAGSAYDVKVDASGNIVYVDVQHETLRRISAADGTVTTIAGVPAADNLARIQALSSFNQSTQSSLPSGGRFSRRELIKARVAALTQASHNGLKSMARSQAVSASAFHFDDPVALAIDASGNIFVADDFAQVVYEIAGNNVTIVAGQPYVGNYSGDGGLATAAELNSPEALAFDNAGNLLIADSGNDIVRKIDKVSGNISTIAGLPLQTNTTGDGGPATAAGLVFPDGLAVDSIGNIFIADGDANFIRKIDTSGNISTIAGTGGADYFGDGGPATSAAFNSPGNLALDAAGSLYIADYENNVIRKIDSAGNIHTVAGNPSANTYAGAPGLATAFDLGNLNAVAVESNGAIDIGAGTINYVVRAGSTTILDFGTLSFGDSAQQTLTLSNVGSSPIQFSGAPVVAGVGYTIQPASTNGCDFSSTLTLAPGAQCDLVVSLTINSYGVDAGSLTFSDNAATSTQVINLNAVVLKPASTTTLSVDHSSISAGGSVLLSASVSGFGSGNPTGSVSFFDDQPTGQVLIANAKLDGSDNASFTATSLSAGTHRFYASYPGDSQYNNSQSAEQTVSALGTPITSIVLTATPGTVTPGATINASVTLTASTTPTGTVLFRMAG